MAEERKSLSESLKALAEHRYIPTEERLKSVYQAPTDEPPPMEQPAKSEVEPLVEVAPPVVPSVEEKEEEEEVPYLLQEKEPGVAPGIGGKGFWFKQERGEIGEIGVPVDVRVSTKAQRDVYRNLDESYDPMGTAELIAAGTVPHDPGRYTPEEFRNSAEPSWYETIFHWLEPFDWPRRYAFMAGYGAASLLPDPTEPGEEETFTSSLGDAAQTYVGRYMREQYFQATESGLDFLKAAVTRPFGPLAAIGEEESPYDQIGESLYKAFATGELYEIGKNRRGMVYADGEGGGIPFIDLVGEEGFTTAFPMGEDLLDAAVPKHLAMELAQKTDSPVNKALFDMLSSHWGRVGLGIAIEIAADPLWFAGPAGGSKTVTIPGKVVTLNRSMVRTAGSVARLTGDDVHKVERLLATRLMGEPGSAVVKAADDYLETAQKMAQKSLDDLTGTTDDIGSIASRQEAIRNPARALEAARKEAEIAEQALKNIIRDWGTTPGVTSKMVKAAAITSERLSDEAALFAHGAATATPETAVKYLKSKLRFDTKAAKVFKRDRDLISDARTMITDGLASGTIKEAGRFSVHVPFGKDTYFLSSGPKWAAQTAPAKWVAQTALADPLIRLVSSTADWAKKPRIQDIEDLVSGLEKTNYHTKLNPAQRFVLTSYRATSHVAGAPMWMYQMLANSFGTRHFQPFLAEIKTRAQLSTVGAGGMGNMFARVPLFGSKFIALKRVSPHIWAQYQEAVTNYMRKVVSLEDMLFQHENRIMIAARNVHKARNIEAEKGLKAALSEERLASAGLDKLTPASTEADRAKAQARFQKAKKRVDQLKEWSDDEYGTMSIVYETAQALESGAVHLSEHEELRKIAPLIEAFIQDFANKTKKSREEVRTALANISMALEGDISLSRLLEDEIKVVGDTLKQIPVWKREHRQAVQALATEFSVKISSFKKMLNAIGTGDEAVDKLARALEGAQAVLAGQPYDQRIHSRFIRDALLSVLKDEILVDEVLKGAARNVGVADSSEAVVVLAERLSRTLREGEESVGKILISGIKSLEKEYAEKAKMLKEAMASNITEEKTYEYLAEILNDRFKDKLARAKTTTGDVLWDDFVKYIEDNPNPKRGWVKLFFADVSDEIKIKAGVLPKPKKPRAPAKADIPFHQMEASELGKTDAFFKQLRTKLSEELGRADAKALEADVEGLSFIDELYHMENLIKPPTLSGERYIGDEYIKVLNRVTSSLKKLRSDLGKLKTRPSKKQFIVYMPRNKTSNASSFSAGQEGAVVFTSRETAINSVKQSNSLYENWPRSGVLVVDEFVVSAGDVLSPMRGGIADEFVALLFETSVLKKARKPKVPAKPQKPPKAPPPPQINIGEWAGKLGSARRAYLEAHAVGMAAIDKHAKALSYLKGAPYKAGVVDKKLAEFLGIPQSKFGAFTRGNLIRKRLDDILQSSKNDVELKENLTEAVRDIFLADYRAPDPLLDELVDAYSDRLVKQLTEEGYEFLYKGERHAVRDPKTEEFLIRVDPKMRGETVKTTGPGPVVSLAGPMTAAELAASARRTRDAPKDIRLLPGVEARPVSGRLVRTPEEAVREARRTAKEVLKAKEESILQQLEIEGKFAGKQLEDLQKATKAKLDELKKLKEEVTPRIPVPTAKDRKGGTRVLEKWEQDLWLEFKQIPEIQKLNEEDLTYAAFLALRGMPDLPDNMADEYGKWMKNYSMVTGKRFGDYDEALSPVVEEMRSMIRSYEKLYEEHGMDFMKKPYDMLKEWGVIEYVPHIANESDLIALGKSSSRIEAVGKSAMEAKPFGGVNSLDARFSTAMDAKKKRRILGTIDEINAMTSGPKGELTLTLEPMAVIARYMQANRAMSGQEMMVSLLNSGVMRVVKSEPGKPSYMKAVEEDLVPLFQRPSIQRDFDVLMNGNLDDINGLPRGPLAPGEQDTILREIGEWAAGLREGKRYKDVSPFATWIREAPLLQQGVNIHEAIIRVRLAQYRRGESRLFNAVERFDQIKSQVLVKNVQNERINKAVEKATRSAKRKTSSWEDKGQALIHIQEQAGKGRDRAIWDEVAQELRNLASLPEELDSNFRLPAVSGQMLSTYFADGQEVWKLYVPQVIAQSMQDTFELDRLGTGLWPKKLADRINAFWKTRLTIISTAFTTRNIVSNEMTKLLDLGPLGALNPVTNFNASRLSLALQYSERYGSLRAAREAIYAPKQAHESTWDHLLRRRSQGMFKFVDSLIENGIDLGDGLLMTADDAIKILKDNGVASGAYTQFVDINRAEQGLAELMLHGGKKDWSSRAKHLMTRAEDAIITAVPMAMTGAFLPITMTKQFGAEVARVVENQARISNFIGNMRRSGNIKEAANHANKFLFNYNDLTAVQKTWMRTIFPFFTWNNKNIHLQLEMMQKSPVFYSQFGRLLTFGLPRIIDAADNENYVRKPTVTKDELKIRMPHTLSMVRVPIPQAVKKIPVISELFGLERMPKETYLEGLGLPIEPFVEMMSIIGNTADYKRTYDAFFGVGAELGRKPLYKPLGHMHFAGRLGLEMALGQHTYYDKPIKDLTNGRLIAQSLVSIARFNPELAALAANALGLMPVQEVNFNGEIGTPVYVSGGVNHLFMNVPYSRFLRDASAVTDAYRVSLARTYRDVSSEEFEEIPYAARVLDALTGVRLVQMREEMERRIYESRLREAQMEHHERRGYSWEPGQLK